MSSVDDPRALFETAAQQHQSGRLDEAETLYRRVLALNPRVFPAYNNLGVILRKTYRPQEAEQILRRVLALKPDYVAALNNLGLALKAQYFREDALDCFERALALEPNGVEALNNMGGTLWAIGRSEEAIPFYERALALRPDFVEALTGIGTVHMSLGRVDAAVACYERALALNPNNVETLSNFANLTENLGKFDQAVSFYQRALAIDPEFPQARFGLYMSRLLHGDFATGMEIFAWNRRVVDPTEPQRIFDKPVWDGSAPGYTVLIHADYGLGDSIHFGRYAALMAARGNRVVLEVQRPLVTLLRQLEGVETIVARGDPLPPFDFHAPTLTLPGLFKTTLDTIPAKTSYLAADPEKQDVWRRRLPQAPLHIGLAWSGNARFGNDRNRSIPLSAFLPLIQSSGAQWHVLQKEFRPGDEELIATTPSLAQYADDVHDFSDTAALASLMDLVIGVDTSVIHLTAALGLPTWAMVPIVPDWRWLLGRRDSPWYPTLRLFRQSTSGDWRSVLAEVGNALPAVQRRLV